MRVFHRICRASVRRGCGGIVHNPTTMGTFVPKAIWFPGLEASGQREPTDGSLPAAEVARVSHQGNALRKGWEMWKRSERMASGEGIVRERGRIRQRIRDLNITISRTDPLGAIPHARTPLCMSPHPTSGPNHFSALSGSSSPGADLMPGTRSISSGIAKRSSPQSAGRRRASEGRSLRTTWDLFAQ